MVKGRDNLLTLLNETHNSVNEWQHIRELTAEAYNYLEELFIEQYGPAYFHSELSLAIRVIDKRCKVLNVEYGGRKRPKQWNTYKTIQEVVKEIFNEADQEQDKGETKFVGTKQLNPEQFSLYQKAMYWLAGARLVS